MFPKVIRSATTFPLTEEPVVQLISSSDGLIKVAEEGHHCREICDYLTTVQPEEGFTYVLILALGSSDHYGCNRNGDWFSEEELLDSFKSFEEGPAYLYRHHQNKNPQNAAGKVIKAFWNPVMKRVEIVVRIDNSKAPDVVEKLIAGVPVATSMGCKVQYDVCSECGNTAKTRAQYCDHLRFQMRHIFEDGRQIHAINRKPKFFDISLVFRPADRTSYILKKVASDGSAALDYDDFNSATLADVQEKMAEIGKLSDITKIIRGIPSKMKVNGREKDIVTSYRDEQLPKLVNTHEHLRGDLLNAMSGVPGVTIIRVSRGSGLNVTTPEMCRILYAKKVNEDPSRIPMYFGKAISMVLPFILELLRNRQDIVEKVTSEESDFYESPEDEEKMASLLPYFPESRRIDSLSLIKKASEGKAGFSWSEAASAWKEIFSLDGPGRQETVKVALPNGNMMVIPREDLLHAIVLDYRSNMAYPKSAPVNWPLAASAAVAGILSSVGPAKPENAPPPIPASELVNVPGIRGRIVKTAEFGYPSLLTSAAIDYRLAGSMTEGQEIEDLIKESSVEKVMRGLEQILWNQVKKVGSF